MKNLYLLFSFALMSIFAFGQAPQGINYQTVIRDGDGQPIVNTAITLKMSIRTVAANGIIVYSEIHPKVSNSFGLVNLIIGQGTTVEGEFSAINWGVSSYFLETAIDLTGIGQFQVLGVTQFLSVPYALEANHAKKASSLTLIDENGNEYQVTVDTLGHLAAIPILPEWQCGNSFTDIRDGQAYATVQIGTQCWMAENLNIGTRIECLNEQINNGIIEKYCYDNLDSNCDTYGGLYQWNEMMQYSTTPGVQGICPTGWHLPTDTEWTTLTTYLGGESVAGGKMKSTGTIEEGTGLWNSPNEGATNSSGLRALPAGYRYTDGTSSNLGYNALLWSSTENDGSNPWDRNLTWVQSNVGRYPNYLAFGFSVRCLNDVTTTTQLNVTPTNQEVTTPAGTTNFEVTSNTSWAVEENVLWLAVSPLSGDGNGTLTVSYEANSSSESRIGQITITAAGGNPAVIVTVNQAGAVQWSCGQSFTDVRDGKNYNTVQIGTQCWMAENLNIGTRIECLNEQINNGIIEKYCYDNLDSNCDTYGGLYQWNEMMQYSTTPGVQGICPTGWHIPTYTEWTTLTTYLGGESVAGGKLKEAGTTHWYSPNTGAINSSGFTALPGGGNGGGEYVDLVYYGYWWSSTVNSSNAWYRFLYYDSGTFYRGSSDQSYAFSVRCLRD